MLRFFFFSRPPLPQNRSTLYFLTFSTSATVQRRTRKPPNDSAGGAETLFSRIQRCSVSLLTPISFATSTVEYFFIYLIRQSVRFVKNKNKLRPTPAVIAKPGRLEQYRKWGLNRKAKAVTLAIMDRAVRAPLPDKSPEGDVLIVICGQAVVPSSCFRIMKKCVCV